MKRILLEWGAILFGLASVACATYWCTSVVTDAPALRLVFGRGPLQGNQRRRRGPIRRREAACHALRKGLEGEERSDEETGDARKVLLVNRLPGRPLTGRRNARRANNERISFAQESSSEAVCGRQTKILRRLGVSLTPVTS